MSEPIASAPINPSSQRRPRRRPGGYSAWHGLQTVVTVALLMASLLTFWSPDTLFNISILERVLTSMETVASEQPSPPAQPTQTAAAEIAAPLTVKPRIGLISGHWGNDPGFICSDGLTEEQVNLEIAQRLSELLQKEGFDVRLFKEFDPNLKGFSGVALISIHNDTCDFLDDQSTGFKIAPVSGQEPSPQTERLEACLVGRYQERSGLKHIEHRVTRDMSEYHPLDEIDPATPAVVVETGFLNLDREILLQQPGELAKGLSDGIICYAQNKNINP